MTPQTEAELAEIISSTRAPLAIHGGSTRGVPVQGDRLDMTHMTGITLYEPGAMTLVAQAGTPLAEIDTVLAAENQRLAFEVPNLRDVMGTQGQSTIGGVVASNASGPRRISAGACRDFALGVRFVDGMGRVVKNGGRVMKNVTGYDLVKLMAGSHGTLGVLTEVSLKVLPNVEMQASLRLEGLSVEACVQAMSAALGSPFEVSGAAQDLDGTLWLRLEGFEASVRYRAAELIKRLPGAQLIEQTGSIWDDIRDLRDFSGGGGDLWRISVKPSDAPAVLDTLQPKRALLDWVGGLIWAELPAGTNARDHLSVPGHATLIRASQETFATLGRFHPETAALAKITEGIRAQFDPHGLLNAGLMGGAV